MYVSDVDLLDKWLRNSDSDAFSEIVSRHASMVHGTCTRVLGDAAEAEDVAQDCFIKLCEVRNLKGASLRGLLHTLATHLSLNRLRAQSRRRQREIAFVMSKDTRTTPNWDDVQPCVDEAIANLPEKLRYPIISRYLESQTYEAIAQTLGIDESTVRYRVKKGIGHVRRSLRRRGISLGATALAGMLQAQVSEAVALPVGLKAALGKLAVAGRPELVAGVSSVVETLGISKLALIGGTALMWKKLLLAFGVVIVALTASYTIHSREAPSSETPSAEETPEESVPAREAKSNVPRSNSNANESVLPAETPNAGADELAAVLMKLLASASTRAGERQAAGTGEVSPPYTSKDIPLDNGAHYFLLAAELFPDVDLKKLYAKREELQANGFSDDPEFQTMLEEFQEAFDAIRTGLEVGNARMPPVKDPRQSTPHLTTFRHLARVMNMEARYYAAQGHYGASVDDHITMLNFASESSRGGVVINGLVGFAIEKAAAQSLRETLAQEEIGSDDYRFLIGQLEVLDKQMNSAWEMMETEAGQVNSWLDRSLESGIDLRGQLEAGAPGLRDTARTMTDEGLEAMFREAFQDYDVVIDYLALPYYEAQRVDLHAFLGENPMSYLLRDAMASIPVQEAAVRAEVRGTMLVSALELCALENGAYPDSLEDLKPGYVTALPEDPFSGQAFGYSPSGSGYTLWSAGPDMRDDGGAPLDGAGAFHEREGDILIRGGESLGGE